MDFKHIIENIPVVPKETGVTHYHVSQFSTIAGITPPQITQGLH